MRICKSILVLLLALCGCDGSEGEGNDFASDAGDGLVDAGDVVDAALSPDAAPEPLQYKNIVLDASGDPDCSYFDGAYYLYLPRQVREGGVAVGGKVVGFRSVDLVHWEALGEVFNNVDEAYGGQTTKGLWAPEVLAYGGKYYLYYVNVMTGGIDPDVGDKDIVVIESDDPADFHGGTGRRVLLDGDYAFIDPSPFEDPETGELFLLFKRRNARGTGSRLVIRPMSDPRSFSGPQTVLLESSELAGSGQVEHPMMYATRGTYFLMFSYGLGDEPSYHIVYATSTDPTGPFVLRETLFESDSNLSGDLSERVIAPGASSVVSDGVGQTWMVYRQKKTAEKSWGDRGVTIDPIQFKPGQNKVTGTPTKGVVRPGPQF